LLLEGELRDPMWDSHSLPRRDIFSAADEIVLRQLPRFLLAKKEERFDNTRRALKALCEFLAKHAKSSTATIREAFTTALARQADDAGLSLTTATALHASLLVLDEGSAAPAATSFALWQLGLAWLRCSKEHFNRVDRLQLAVLAVAPSGEREVAEWSTAKKLVPADPSVSLLLRPSGGF
jgi:hypothetical protein